MNKTVSVWLSIEDGENKEKFVLQKRSERNETFPFICQATWAGKVEAGESIEDAIKRECKEELGDDFFNSFDFFKLKFIDKSEYLIGEEKVVCSNYFANINEEQLKLVKIHNESLPKFTFVNNKSNIYSISSNKDPNDNIVLFNDQYEILKQIL